MSQPRLMALVLAFVTLLVFLPTGWFGFLNFDDPDYVTDNSFVFHGLTWTDLRWAFTTFHAGNWHPLTWISHMTDCQFFGLIPGAHHLINVLFHAANTGLLFVWLQRMTGKAGAPAVIAGLFAWHPLHVESVAWIAERKDVLSTFFALLALLAYTRFAQEGRRRNLWYAVIFFALGLLAKPMLVTLPFLLLLLDFWPLNRLADSGRGRGQTPARPPMAFRDLCLEKWPFFLLTAGSCVVTYVAQQRGEAVTSLAAEPPGLRVENSVLAMTGYLREFLLPVHLCAIYPLPERIPGWQWMGAVIFLGGLTAMAWRWRRERPYLLTGWLWFAGSLIPVIGLVQVGAQAMADRYTYIPSIGFFLAAVFLGDEWLRTKHLPNRAVTLIALAPLLACMVVTEHQLRYWHDSEALFRRAIAVTRDNHVAHMNLGVALAGQKQYDEALGEFREALRLQPGLFRAYYNIGNIYEAEGRPAGAADEYRRAIGIKPEVPYLHENLGKSLTELGQYEAARDEFLTAERLDPGYAWPHIGMARLLLAVGRDSEAAGELHTAIGLEPDNYGILAYAAHVLAADENPAARDGRTAVSLALKAGALSGNQPEVIDVLGMALAETGDFSNAQTCAQSVLEAAATTTVGDTNQIRARLELYQKSEPWHESFRGTNSLSQ